MDDPLCLERIVDLIQDLYNRLEEMEERLDGVSKTVRKIDKRTSSISTLF